MDEWRGIRLEEFTPFWDRKLFGSVFCQREPYNMQELIQMCTFPKIFVDSGRGTGKTQVLIGDDTIFKSAFMPVFDMIYYGLDKPLPNKTIIIGNVKDTAKMSQDNIRNGYNANEFLQGLVKDQSQTRLETKDGSTIEIRTASASARGIHALVKKDKKTGLQINHKIFFKLDEYWFFENRELMENVIIPSTMHAGYGSQIACYTTPFGQQGAGWDIYNGSNTHECPQKYTIDPITKIRTYQFDRSLCERCKKEYVGGWMLFRLESYQNTALTNRARRELLATRERLINNGRGIVWNQEYLGLPSATAGKFFTQQHMTKMLNESAGFDVEERSSGNKGIDLWNIAEILTMAPKYGNWIIGIDPNSGVQMEKSDYGALMLVEETIYHEKPKRYLRFAIRVKKGDMPDVFPGVATNMLSGINLFLIRLVEILVEKKLKGKIKIRIDQGYGQAIMSHLEPKYKTFTDIAYVTNSIQSYANCFLSLRSWIEMDVFKSPGLNWLIDEMKYINVEINSEKSHNRMKISKARSGWGDSTTVDGIFALAFTFSDAEDQVAESYISSINVEQEVVSAGSQLSINFSDEKSYDPSFTSSFNDKGIF